MPKPNQHGYRAVASKWSSGNLQFLDASGNVIFTIDAANRKVTLPSGSTLDTSAGTMTPGVVSAPTWTATTSFVLGVGGKITTTPYTSGVQGATANVIDVTKSVQHWAVDSGTGAANAVTPSAAGTTGDLLLLKYAATTGTVTMTFGSGFKPSATLAVTVNHYAYVCFQSDGTNWNEMFRSAIITS